MSFQCGKCERSFSSQGALNGHQRSHSFFQFLGTLRPKEEREKERKDAHDSIVFAAIKHFSHNYTKTGEPTHCDVCAVVKEKVDGPLIRDMVAWMENGKAKETK